MATTSFTALRRSAGFVFALLLFGLCLSGEAAGQATVPLVTATSAAGLSHPTGWGTIRDTAVDSFGDWFVVDYSNGALYEFPAGGGAAVTLGPPGATGAAGSLGQGNNPGIAIDPNNNIYLEANWNNCVVMFPYSGSGMWAGLNAPNPNTLTLSNSNTAICTNSGSNNEAAAFAQYGLSAPAASGFPGYFQPWGIAIGNSDNLLIGNQNSGNFIFSLSVTNAWTSPVAGPITSEPINTMSARPISIAQDPEGNIYFVEEPGQTHALPGVYEIPAGTGAAGGPPALSTDVGLTRVDPNLPSVTGVITDATGNLYVSDSTAGVFMIPNPSGTPQTSATVMLTSVPAQGEVAIDWTRNILYIPTAQQQANGQADVAEVTYDTAELGSSPVGTPTARSANVGFSFNGSATPANFVIVEDGVQKPDFAITGGSCTTGKAYAALSGCLESVTMTPHSVGSISARLLMVDASNNVLASLPLHGTGVGSNIQVSPASESSVGGSLMAPTQIAADAAGDVYVADGGLGKVLKYAAGSGASSAPVSIGTGLTSPTGVAVDGAGDVFIADGGSGSVFEVPYGTTGLNAAGQVTLVSGLGADLSLALDGLGNVFIADPGNKRVVEVSIGITGQLETMLTAGFTAPSAVAADASNNLYVVDGANLFELAAQPGNVLGAPTTPLNNLSGATGVAADPSGAVYISSTGGTVRIPSVNGSLVPTAETLIAQSVTKPEGVALDRMGNVYLADGTALNVHVVSIAGTLALPTPATLTSSTSLPATITNDGNSTLSVTGYTSTNSVDFTAADGTCVGDSPLAAGATCQVDVTFDPGAGEQGSLTSQIGITSNAVNSPILIDATGTGLTLANSAANFTVAGTAEVVNAPLTLTVASKSGTGAVPTGEVTISYPSWVSQNPVGCGNPPLQPCVPTVTPVTNTLSATLDATGKATVNLAPILAGSQAVTVTYGGDRVFGRSTSTVTATVAKSAVTSITLPKFPDPSDINLPFVVPSTGSDTVPYDGSENPWQYQFNITVNTAIGAPTGTVTVMDDSTACPPGTSATGLGTAACVLTSYSGIACPQQAGDAKLTVQSSGTAPVGPVAFPTNCLWNVPSGITYSPVIFTHYIWPVYSGDANFLAYTGPTKTVLQAVRGPMVQITQTGNAASQTVAPTLTVQHGSSASINLTLTSILGYGIAGRNMQLNDSNFPVSLACDVPIPHAECTISYVATDDPDQVTAPNSVQIPCPSSASTTEVAAGTVQCTPGLATVTVYTDVAVGTTTSQNARDASVTLGALFGFGMVGLFFRRRAFEKGHRLLMILLMIVGGALAVSVTACSTTNLSPQSSLASTPGTYPMTITASEVGTQTINLANGAVTIYGSQNQVSLPFVVNVTVQ